MDDGWEMSDGVQAKVPIRGQPKGGVSPTGANGRRLGETAAVAAARPRLLNPSHLRRSVFSSALHFLSIHIHTLIPQVTLFCFYYYFFWGGRAVLWIFICLCFVQLEEVAEGVVRVLKRQGKGKA